MSDGPGNACPWILAIALLLTQGALGLESDRDQPIQIVADLAVRDEGAGETRYQGNVILTQGSLRITADLISIQHDATAAEEIVATGAPATLVQTPAPDQAPVDASANRIEYIRSQDLVKLIDEARIAQNGSILSGDQIDYLVNERRVRAAGNSSPEGSGRVEVVIPPENLRRPTADD